MSTQRLVLLGAGGHARSLVDLVRSMGCFTFAGAVDDHAVSDDVLGVPVLRGDDPLGQVWADGVRLAVNAVGGIADIESRIAVTDHLAARGFRCPTLVHTAAVVEPSATLDSGAQVFANAYVGSAVRIGEGVILNTGAVVSHDCVIEAHANISPGALLAGGVVVAEAARIGMGATVNLGLRIGDRARVGNSAVVKADVPDGAVVRAGCTWPA